MIVFLLIIFFILLACEVPIAIALLFSTIFVLGINGYEPTIVIHRMINSLSSFSLVAVPLYVLAGNLCGKTGITKRLVKMCSTLVGHIPGGTGLVNVLASLFFGGISGSAVADTSAVGGMLIPVMKEEGYDSEFAAGITMASSTIGILIPPSIPQCLYGICAGVSIGAMFMAGIIPGLLVGLLQMIICYIISKKRNYPKCKKASWKQRVLAIKEAIWALGMPLIILIGCGMGIVTASEAGVIAVVYSLFIGFFVYKELKISDIPQIFSDSICTSAISLLIVGVASVVSWTINIDNVPTLISGFLRNKVDNVFLVMLIINILLFICGCFMDLVPVMLLFAPIFLPIATSYGISAEQFGIIMTINLGIGLLTPPVGNCLFIASDIAKSPPLSVFKMAFPFIMCNIICLILVHFMPCLTTWLPSLMK